MKKITSILILSLLILGCHKSFTLDNFELYSTEGFIACVVAAEQSNPQPAKPDVVSCKCNGTGKVKTGDGINETQCPCGKDCKCGKNSSVKHKRRVILLTSKKCSPCRQFAGKPTKELKAQNWTFGNSSCLIEIVECEEKNNEWVTDRKDLIENYKLNLSQSGIPMFLLLEDEKLISANIGFMTSKQFTDFYYQAK